MGVPGRKQRLREPIRLEGTRRRGIGGEHCPFSACVSKNGRSGLRISISVRGGQRIHGTDTAPRNDHGHFLRR